MPYTDTHGDHGFYTGDVNKAGDPDGTGSLRYDDGDIIRGRWENGEMIAEGTEVAKKSSDGTEKKKKTKEQEIAEFHERNQAFLRKAAEAEVALMNQQAEEGSSQASLNAEATQLIYSLQEQIRSLSHELRMTQDAHQLYKDESLSKIEMLQSELERQNSRHEQIAASLRHRLVESETARMKMQDQLAKRMEEEQQRDEDLKTRWKEMTSCVLEDKKWVDEQMNYWKESMDEHKRRLGDAKVRGILDAGIPTKDGGRTSMNNNGGGRLSQRKMWGEGYDEDSEDEEIERMFGRNK